MGWVLWRDRKDLPEQLVFHVSCLGGDMPTFQINFSRPAGQVIAQYYGFVHLGGRQGYRTIQQACADNARHFVSGLMALGSFELIHDGDAAQGILAVVWTMTETAQVGSAFTTSPTGCACGVGRFRRSSRSRAN